MDLTLIIVVVGLVIVIVICFLQVIIPFIKGEVKLTKDFHLFDAEARHPELSGEK